MKATITAVAASLLACYGSAVAQETQTTENQEAAEGIPATPHQAGTAREVESELFERLDKDGDGVVSREEAQGSAMLSDNWSQFDQDGDGALDEREFGDFRAEQGKVTRGGEPSVAGAGQTGAGQTGAGETGAAEGMPETRHQEQTVGGDVVEQLDTDGDGQISQQEAQSDPRVADNWNQYDQDGDGQLDSREQDRLEQELGDTEEAE